MQDSLKKLHVLKIPIVKMSAKTGDGLQALKRAIVDTISKGFEKFTDDVIITSKRQKETIDKTTEHISQARLVLENKGGYEFATVDMRQALNTIGELTGETVTDDILNNIFKNFCIGK